MTRPLRDPVDLVVGGASVPSHASKQNLIAPWRRAAAMTNIANTEDVDALAMFELTDDDRDRVDARRRWAVWHTTANTRTRRKTIRTTLAVRRPWVRRGRVRSIAARIHDRRRRTIYMPVVGIARRRFRRREATLIAAHVVRKKLDPAGNLAALHQVADTAERLIDRGHRVVVVIDSNRRVDGNDGTGPIFRPRGLSLAVADGPDQIWIGPHIECVAARVVKAHVKGRISDHPMTRARLRLLPTKEPR